jgi:hypothetical protein
MIFASSENKLYLLNMSCMVVKFSEISPKYGDTGLSILAPSKHYFCHMLIHQVIFIFRLERISTPQASSLALACVVELWQTRMIV